LFLTPIEKCGLRSYPELMIRIVKITMVGAVKITMVGAVKIRHKKNAAADGCDCSILLTVNINTSRRNCCTPYRYLSTDRYA
jgi:hypothetical protein